MSVLVSALSLERQFLWFIARERIRFLNEFFLDVTALGSVTVMVLVLVGLWMLDQREASVLSGLALSISGSIAAVSKIVIARPRPETGIETLPYAMESYAFPSGHATLVFTAATVLAHEHPDGKPYFYGIAVLVAVSRVYLGVHHVTDIIGGAVLGITVSLLVIKYRETVLDTVRQVYPGL